MSFTRFHMIPAILVVTAVALAGCAKAEAVPTTLPTESTALYLSDVSSSSFLEGLELTLPDIITREHISATADYFYKDGEIVGGIALLDSFDQAASSELQAYTDQALAVMKAISSAEYDCMAESDDFCHAIVSVSDENGQEFYHFFFSGTEKSYDIWMSTSVLDVSTMKSCLKSLRSEDLPELQTRSTADDEIPLLNLTVIMPEGVAQWPTALTRSLFYSEDTVADGINSDSTIFGGIEQITPSSDLDALGLAAESLAEEIYGDAFDYIAMEGSADSGIAAAISMDGAGKHIVHYIRNIGTECYDIWGDTAFLSEEDIQAIAESCKY